MFSFRYTSGHSSGVVLDWPKVKLQTLVHISSPNIDGFYRFLFQKVVLHVVTSVVKFYAIIP